MHTLVLVGEPGTADEVKLRVNGRERTVRCEPDTPLLDVLRHDLGLTGPKFGCGIGLCGVCFVIIDGRARSSCDLAASAASGKEITTVEGLPDGGELKQAFIAEQAAQCGYCIPGMIVSAAALLREKPSPTEDQVREGLDGNLCRCGTHRRIVNAVLKAAARGGRPPGPAGRTAE